MADEWQAKKSAAWGMIMNSTTNLRAWFCTGLIALFCVSTLTSKADPIGGWATYQTSFYGYGGDFIDMVRYNFDYRAEMFSNRFPIAVAKTYAVKRSKTGIGIPVTITSVDQVEEFFGYIENMGLPIIARAVIDDSPALLSDSNYRSQKGWAIFMAAQAMFICGDGSSIPGPVAVTGGTSSYAANNTADSLFQTATSCPDGSVPVYAAAVYAHGIGPQ